MTTHSLHEINEFVRRVLALNAPEPVWVSAETSQVSESRGHYFLDLVEKEKDGEAVVAQAAGVLWQSDFRRLRRQYGRRLQDVLQRGLAVRLQVRLDFHERYGLRFIVQDIDPAFTLGQLAATRERTLEQLRKEQLLDRNAQLSLPPVVQRIAIISSPMAAGYADFLDQLETNEFGYRFRNRLFAAAMQGAAAPAEIMAQIHRIEQHAQPVDAIVLIRGGGSRLDLAAFDDAELCRVLAQAKYPVITGIGHEIDRSIADRVAHTSLNTPTAVAEWLTGRMQQFETRLVQHARWMARQVQQKLRVEQVQLQQREQRWTLAAQRAVQKQQQRVDRLAQSLPLLIGQRLQRATQRLRVQEEKLAALDPQRILARGYVRVEKQGQPVVRAAQVEPGERVELHFADGLQPARIESPPAKKTT